MVLIRPTTGSSAGLFPALGFYQQSPFNQHVQCSIDGGSCEAKGLGNAGSCRRIAAHLTIEYPCLLIATEN